MCTHDAGFTVLIWPKNPRWSIQVCNRMCGFFVPVDSRSFRKLLFRAREQFKREKAGGFHAEERAEP